MSGQALQLSNVRELGAYLGQYAGSIKATLPAQSRLTAERFVRLAANAARSTPELLRCHPASVVNSLLFFAQLDLEPATALGHGWLVPYGAVCQPIVGYRGYIELALRMPEYAGMEAHVVRANDTFRHRRGTTPRILHEPNFGARGEVIGAYAICTRADGGKQFDVLDKEEIDAVRERSRAGGNGPWKTDYAEMAKKTAVRRLAKYLRLSPHVASAFEAEDRAESGATGGYSDALDEGAIDLPAQPDTGLRDDLRRKAEAARQEKQ